MIGIETKGFESPDIDVDLKREVADERSGDEVKPPRST
jgi:hypothetical protein